MLRLVSMILRASGPAWLFPWPFPFASNTHTRMHARTHTLTSIHACMCTHAHTQARTHLATTLVCPRTSEPVLTPPHPSSYILGLPWHARRRHRLPAMRRNPPSPKGKAWTCASSSRTPSVEHRSPWSMAAAVLSPPRASSCWSSCSGTRAQHMSVRLSQTHVEGCACSCTRTRACTCTHALYSSDCHVPSGNPQPHSSL